MAFPGNCRFLHIDQRRNVLTFLCRIAQRRKRIRCLARLRNHQRQPVVRQRRLAIAKFGRHIDIHRQSRIALEPVLGHQSCIKGRPARRDRQPRQLCEIEWQFFPQLDRFARQIDVMRQRVRHGLGLLVDFLGHEMAMIALVGQSRRRRRHLPRPLDDSAIEIENLHLAGRNHRPVALFEIGYLVGEWSQRKRIGPQIHLVLSMPDRQG